MSITHDDFIHACRQVAGELSLRAIAERIGLSHVAIIQKRFNVEGAVAAWNQGGNPPLVFVPARVLPAASPEARIASTLAELAAR